MRLRTIIQTSHLDTKCTTRQLIQYLYTTTVGKQLQINICTLTIMSRSVDEC